MDHVDRAISGRAFGRFTQKHYAMVRKSLEEKSKGKTVPKKDIFREVGLR